MSTPVLIAIIAVGVALVLAFLATAYNRLVTLRQRLLNSFSQIDVQLKRRHDLIPNLVETVKGYMVHERQTLEAVVQVRNAAGQRFVAGRREPCATRRRSPARQWPRTCRCGAGTVRRDRGKLSTAQGLRAAGRLMEELASTENRIAFARQAYNDAVMRYNTGIMTFPNNLIAGPFGFWQATLFELDSAAEREVVQVVLGGAAPSPVLGERAGVRGLRWRRANGTCYNPSP